MLSTTACQPTEQLPIKNKCITNPRDCGHEVAIKSWIQIEFGIFSLCDVLKKFMSQIAVPVQMMMVVALTHFHVPMVKEIVTVIQTAKLAFAVVWTIVTLALGFLITMTVAMAQV